MQKRNFNRRDFLQVITAGTLIAGFGAVGAQGDALAQLPAPTEPLSEGDSLATTLGYHQDAKKVDTAKWIKRKGPEGEKQFCSNCNFYQGDLKQIEGKGYGKCQLFQNGLVSSGGWCNSWVAKIG